MRPRLHEVGRLPCLVVALFLLLSCSGCDALSLTREENQELLRAALADPTTTFVTWAAANKKPYTALFASTGPTSAGDKADVKLMLLHPAYSNWVDNARYAAEYNEKHAASGHWLGLNSLADLSLQQYRRLLGTRLSASQLHSIHRKASPMATGAQSADDHEGHHEDHHEDRSAKHQASKAAASSILRLGYAARPHAKEFEAHWGVQQEQQAASGQVPGFLYSDVDVGSLPRGMDWRNSSAVTEVKNQGMCGSCWAFATTGAIEGVNAIYSKELLSLSEQELVDCDRDSGDQGCSGGMMNYAYEWIIQDHRGLHLERDWPYQAVEDPLGCDAQLHSNGRRVTIDGWQEVPVGDEVALLKAVAHHPVAVAVEADSRAFQLYMGGVMSDPGCGSQLNHGVLVVGYGGLDRSGHFPDPASAPADPAQGPYWIVKNSWGPEWGAGGYIKLQMGFRDNVTGLPGMCGITLAASFPIKRTPNPPAPHPKPTPPPSPTPPVPPPRPPPPPPPGPVKCDGMYACPAESTCCCLDDEPSVVAFPPGASAATMSKSKGKCSNWGCCPIPEAVCCEDHLHCCPPELPVCDTDMGRCMPKQGAGQLPAGFSIPWYHHLAAQKVGADAEATPEVKVAVQ